MDVLAIIMADISHITAKWQSVTQVLVEPIEFEPGVLLNLCLRFGRIWIDLLDEDVSCTMGYCACNDSDATVVKGREVSVVGSERETK